MARRKKDQPILLAEYEDCLLGISFPRMGEAGPPVAVYSADMIAARMRDEDGLKHRAARNFVADHIETLDLGPGTPRIVWAATVTDFGPQATPE
jgi:hypothetical protein